MQSPWAVYLLNCINEPGNTKKSLEMFEKTSLKHVKKTGI